MKEPIAGPEPEIAAKNMQAIVVTSARPPVTWPTSLLKRLSRRREMPPYIMKLPATTKNGIARSVKESRPVKQDCARSTGERSVVKIMTARVPQPRQTPMGTPRIRRPKRQPNKIAKSILKPPLLLQQRSFWCQSDPFEANDAFVAILQETQRAEDRAYRKGKIAQPFRDHQRRCELSHLDHVADDADGQIADIAKEECADQEEDHIKDETALGFDDVKQNFKTDVAAFGDGVRNGQPDLPDKNVTASSSDQAMEELKQRRITT